MAPVNRRNNHPKLNSSRKQVMGARTHTHTHEVQTTQHFQKILFRGVSRVVLLFSEVLCGSRPVFSLHLVTPTGFENFSMEEVPFEHTSPDQQPTISKLCQNSISGTCGSFRVFLTQQPSYMKKDPQSPR